MTDTQTIKDRIDIVQLIGEYITLKKAGANWKANCPFHNEKSPSFMVHPEKQIWHCFGCSKGGDIFTFVQEMEGLEFVEALKMLAKRAGVQIETYQSEVNQSQRNRLLEINAKAAQFFHHILTEQPAAKPARDYLENRKLTKQTIDDWQVGYIPEQWDLLTQFFLKKGYGINDLIAGGLTIKRDNADEQSGRGFYDRFRGRIMFPISDVQGNVVGFTGRVLVETERSGGKYVNTPQTILYDKSRILYGLHRAKMEMRAKDQVVLVEGQMDVIACHQAGMTNVVAASGTALTPEQVKLLKRYTANIAIAFDADAAGENAGKRGIDVALEEGMSIKVIRLPSGFAKDADECIKKDKQVWFTAVAEAKNVMDWYMEVLTERHDLTDSKQKQQVAGLLLEQITRIPYAIERDDWMKKVAERLRIDASILKEELGKQKKTFVRGAKPAAAPVQNKPSFLDGSDPLEILRQELWSLLIKFPEQYARVREELRADYFSGLLSSRLYENAENIYTRVGKLEVEELRQIFEQEQGENAVDVLSLRPYKDFVELDAPRAAQEIEQVLARLKTTWKKKRGKEIELAIAEAERAGDRVLAEKLTRELQTL